jgi:hypothetical protein
MIIPLPPGSSPLFPDARTEMTCSPQMSRQLLGMDGVESPRFQKYLHCFKSIRCCGDVFTKPLRRNLYGIFASLAVIA